MSFFISDAYAQGAAAGQPGMGDLFFLILMFVAIYFLLLRPQMKRTKEHKNMVESLSKGDEAVTSGGSVSVLTGSTMPSVGLSLRWAMPVLAWRSARSKMITPVVSLPVPAVVGTAMKGTAGPV